MRFTQARAAALSLALAAAMAPPARGATVQRLTFEELTHRSETVVRGRVVGSVARLDRAAGRISTFTEIQVTESLKGGPARTIVVRQPGGEAEGIGQAVAGAARFSPGEDVVLFLERARDDAAVFQVLSLSAGKVRLEKKLSSVRAVRDLDGIHFPDEAPQVASPALGPQAPGGVSGPARGGAGVRLVSTEDLGDGEQFLARVRTAVRTAPRAVDRPAVKPAEKAQDRKDVAQ